MAWPRRSRSDVRTVEVVSPSRSDEVGWVAMAAGYILLCMIYVYGFQHEAGPPATLGPSAGTLLPYQVLFRELPNGEQRMFRAMQEGSNEAVQMRGESGDWPSVGTLAAAGVPPFAPDPLDKGGYRWADSRDGLFVNYLGVPAAPDRGPAFLIVMQEPDPVTGERPSPSVADEEHALLPGGKLLHVTYWKRAGAEPDAATVIDPALQGWQQIRVKTLFEELERR